MLSGNIERSTCLSPTFKNPYRYEVYDKMRVRVGVRTAVATDRMSPRQMSLFTAWSDDVFLRQTVESNALHSLSAS